jgi:hypothetical protein
MYKYTLTNRRRSDCPFCGKDGKYGAFMNTKTGELASIEFGMCSSCRESKRPPDNYVQRDSNYVEENKLAYFEADTLKFNTINQFYMPKYYVQNNFIEGLEQKFGEDRVKRVVDLYKLGRFDDSGIVFPYLYTDTHICTAKIMFYDDNLNRVKEGKKQYPRYLHNLCYQTDGYWCYDFRDFDIDENGDEVLIPFKLKLCLFGHNQIVNDKQKTICLVESEKTAVIMSIVFPEFIWVASGGKTLIQDYKFLFFTRRKCLVFADMSENDNVYDYWLEKLTEYSRKYGYDFEFIDYYSEFLENDETIINYCKGKGFDIADFVLHFNINNSYVKFIKNKLEFTLNKDASHEAPMLISENN